MASTERDLTSSSDEQRPSSRDGFRYKITEGPLFVHRKNRGDIWEEHRERRARLKALRDVERAADVAPAPTRIDEPSRSSGGGWMDGPRRMTLTEAFALTQRETSPSPSPIVENKPAVQQSWGSKARRNSGWMGKILDNEESTIPTPPDSSPEKSRQWDADVDFTAQSLQISTSPQLRVQSSKLDEIRSKEIENLTARAVATSRLEEIRERNSEERSFNSDSRTNTTEVPTNQDVAAEDWRHKSIIEEEGEKIPYAPITVFRAKDFEEYVKRNNIKFGRNRSDSGSSSNSRPASRDKILNSDRPKAFAPNFGEGFKKKRDEQRELLRRLSRACSRSASSSPAPANAEEKNKEPVYLLEEVNDATKPQTNPLGALKSETPNHSDEVDVLEKPPTLKLDIVKLEPPTLSDLLDDLEETEIQNSVYTKADTSKPEELNHSDLLNQLKRSGTPASKSDVDPEERITAEARLFELQDNKSERNSVRGPSPASSDDDNFDETPRPRTDPLSLPTPRVTGAYIETPAPTTRVIRQRSISPSYEVVNVPEDVKNSKSKAPTALSERCLEKSESRRRSITPPRGRFYDARPGLINTAKPISAAEDLRRIQLEAQVEDSTLDDFDAILDSEAATEGDTTVLEPALDLEFDEHGVPLSKNEIERRIERLTLDRMNQSLKATSTSIRAARHGIERLEEQVSSSIVKVTQPGDSTTYLEFNIKIPVPKLYVSQPPEKPGMKSSWKLTWFGLISMLFIIWYLCESAMCAQFCHPVASSKNTWQPSDPFFPWAIPTKLDQWTGEIVSSGVGSMANSLGVRSWDWSLIPALARDYKGGPIGTSDWWLGRNGPMGLTADVQDGGFSDDEMIG